MNDFIQQAYSFLSANAYTVALVVLFFAVVSSFQVLLGRLPVSSEVRYVELENMVASPSDAFCGDHDSLAKRENECNELSEDVCGETSCCVWATTGGGRSACVAGSKHGPVYLSDPHAEHMYDVTKFVYMGDTHHMRKPEN